MMWAYGVTEDEVLDWPADRFERYLSFARELFKLHTHQKAKGG